MATVECKVWQGAKDSSGYGNKRLGKKVWSIHRLAWTALYGEIEKGIEIDHICHNEALAKGECDGGKECQHRACYEISHLRAVTKNVNQRDGDNGWGNKTTCKRGHALTEDNIGITSTQRYCKTCYDNAPSQRKVR